MKEDHDTLRSRFNRIFVDSLRIKNKRTEKEICILLFFNEISVKWKSLNYFLRLFFNLKLCSRIFNIKKVSNREATSFKMIIALTFKLPNCIGSFEFKLHWVDCRGKERFFELHLS